MTFLREGTAKGFSDLPTTPRAWATPHPPASLHSLNPRPHNPGYTHRKAGFSFLLPLKGLTWTNTTTRGGSQPLALLATVSLSPHSPPHCRSQGALCVDCQCLLEEGLILSPQGWGACGAGDAVCWLLPTRGCPGSSLNVTGLVRGFP